MSILLWLASPIGRLVAGAAAVLVFVSAFAIDQRNRGADKALAKVERNNAQLSSKAGSAGRKSLDPAARGVLNPYYRD
jgi:hypothetical protein